MHTSRWVLLIVFLLLAAWGGGAAPGGTECPAGYTVTFTRATEFGVDVSIRNQASQPVKRWRLEFDYAAAITSIWNARVVSRRGMRYTVEGESWNCELPGNGGVSFGFNCAPPRRSTGGLVDSHLLGDLRADRRPHRTAREAPGE